MPDHTTKEGEQRMGWYDQFLLGLFSQKASPEERRVFGILIDCLEQTIDIEMGFKALKLKHRFNPIKRLRYHRLARSTGEIRERIKWQITNLVRDVALLGPTEYLPRSMQPLVAQGFVP